MPCHSISVLSSLSESVHGLGATKDGGATRPTSFLLLQDYILFFIHPDPYFIRGLDSDRAVFIYLGTLFEEYGT